MRFHLLEISSITHNAYHLKCNNWGGDKGQWSSGAKNLHELGASEAQYKTAIEKMRKDKMTLSHPQALYLTLKATMHTNGKQPTPINVVETHDDQGRTIYKQV